MEYTKEIKWHDMCRTRAVIITNDGTVYEDDNHQYCLQSFSKDYLSDYNLSDDSDLMDAIKLTDILFREGKFHGFDVFEGKSTKVLASHYPRAYENENVLRSAIKYAKDNSLILTAFTDADKLGDKLMVALSK